MSRRHWSSIRWRLTRLMMATAVVALVLTFSVLVGYQYSHARKDLQRELDSMADMIGATSSAALQFEDRGKALEILGAALSVDPRLVEGSLSTAGNAQIARWIRPGTRSDGDEPGTVIAMRPVVLDGEVLGTIVLVGDSAEAIARWEDYVTLVGGLLVAALALALALSFRLQRTISGPILHLAHQAVRVSAERDYSVRVTRQSHDETGELYDRFNEMLAKIEEGNNALVEAHERLEQRVEERTAALSEEVAERRRTEEQLILARNAAEAASRAKSAFLANMSHELRTPLNAVIGYSELLGEDASASGLTEMADDLTKIQRAGKHLLRLINDILDLTKIEVGKVQLEVEEFAVAALVEEIVSTAEPLARKKSNVLEVCPLDDLGTMVGDATRVRQVLLNLLGNAAKFTNHGRIGFAVTRTGRDGADEVTFRVTDTGIGMTPDQMEQVFHEFVQADSSTTRNHGGTGLGLTISRRLCGLMGGSIRVESEAGLGSTFTVTLPAVAGTTNAVDTSVRPPGNPGEARRPVTRSRPLLLVVDDDVPFSDLVARQVARIDVEVIAARSAAEGVRLAGELRPDAIILDVLLPDAPGYEVMAALKADPALASIPVAIASIVADRARAEALGATVTLAKPVNVDQLRDVVRRLCSWTPGADSAPEPPVRAVAPSAA